MKGSRIQWGQRIVELVVLERRNWKERRACEGMSIGI